MGRCGVIDRLGVRDVDSADSDLAQRAVGIDARVHELDLLAEQRGEPRAAEGGNTPAVELRDRVGVAVASRSQRAQRGGGAVAGLVLAPGGLAAGAIRRPGPLEHRALKPERDKLVVGGAAGRSRLDEPEPVADGESLPQELGALNPGQRSEVVAGELEQIEATRWSLPAAAASA